MAASVRILPNLLPPQFRRTWLLPVLGIFVGHDHVNDFVGNYFGIRLGHSGNTGFWT